MSALNSTAINAQGGTLQAYSTGANATFTDGITLNTGGGALTLGGSNANGAESLHARRRTRHRDRRRHIVKTGIGVVTYGATNTYPAAPTSTRAA